MSSGGFEQLGVEPMVTTGQLIPASLSPSKKRERKPKDEQITSHVSQEILYFPKSSYADKLFIFIYSV